MRFLARKKFKEADDFPEGSLLDLAEDKIIEDDKKSLLKRKFGEAGRHLDDELNDFLTRKYLRHNEIPPKFGVYRKKSKSQAIKRKKCSCKKR